MTHAYLQAQIVEQPASGEGSISGLIPMRSWRGISFKSLAAEFCNYMFLKEFLFEWKTAR